MCTVGTSALHPLPLMLNSTRATAIQNCQITPAQIATTVCQYFGHIEHQLDTKSVCCSPPLRGFFNSYPFTDATCPIEF